jgi:cytochrome b involved in lipid metabolism
MTSGRIPLSVTFTNAVTDPEAGSMTCQIDYGAGAGYQSTACNGTVSQTYSTAGTYTARFKVSDGTNSTSAANISITANAPPAGNSYTAAEVAQHNTQSNCWLIINAKVYELTSYLNSHPAGASAITPYCGADGTQGFITKDKGTPKDHDPSSYTLLDNYYIGNLVVGVNSKPVIGTWSAAPTSGIKPLAVTFTNSVSDPDGDPLTCEINYGEGAGYQSTACNGTASRTYSVAGSYSALFRVSDGKDTTTGSAKNITATSQPVNNPPVVDSFTATPKSGNAPLSVTFTNAVTDPEAGSMTCQIDYGAGAGYQSTACNGTASQTYSTAGTYTARFKVSDGTNSTSAANISITANAPPAGNSYTAAEVAQHNTQSNCWMIMNSKVYNLTAYLSPNMHPPGADEIIPYCGADGTQGFITKDKGTPKDHKPETYTLLESYYIGNLAMEGNSPPMVNSFTGSPVSGNAPLLVTFTNSVSDPDGNPMTCQIDYGAGAGYQSTACNGSVTQTYSVAATRTAKFKVSDGTYTVDATTVSITVGGGAVISTGYCDSENAILAYFTGSIYIDKIKENISGNEVYEGKISVDGIEHKTKHNASGNILSDETKEAYVSATPAMQTTFCQIEAIFYNGHPNDKITQIEIKEEKIEWEVKFIKLADGLLYTLKLDTNGNIISEKLGIAIKNLTAVINAIKSVFK